MRIYAEYVFWFKLVDRLPLRFQLKLLELADWFERRRT